jgi:hypothetical protein
MGEACRVSPSGAVRVPAARAIDRLTIHVRLKYDSGFLFLLKVNVRNAIRWGTWKVAIA